MADSPRRLNIPNGRTASAQEMDRFGRLLQQFVEEREAELASLTDARRHNEIVDYLHVLANSYNEQLRIFRKAEAERMQQMLAIMLQLSRAG